MVEDGSEREAAMAKGREKHQAYQDALNLLGKALARRAGRRCELSEVPGTLVIHDMEGATVTPHMDHVLLVSPTLKASLDGGGIDESAVRCLENAVWSPLPVVRRAAVQLLERIDAPWASDAIENARTMATD